MSEPKAGDRITKHGYEWEWVAPTDALRGAWKSTDDADMEVLPPSEGFEKWMVIKTDDGKERLIELPGELAAWGFAAGGRLSRATKGKGA